ncbi:hypothetical protein IFM89_016236 [Coptis chinensis]|uniref:DUF7086 domain-containing protein n=1 Tax=Coptis chinensis TaxID=261450 RepID=A0A835I1A0_9MAGN|nr:hypothetical protein IFM89_016236 [Coptis chinensis]
MDQESDKKRKFEEAFDEDLSLSLRLSLSSSFHGPSQPILTPSPNPLPLQPQPQEEEQQPEEQLTFHQFPSNPHSSQQQELFQSPLSQPAPPHLQEQPQRALYSALHDSNLYQPPTDHSTTFTEPVGRSRHGYAPTRGSRGRRLHGANARNENITPPFQWATNQRATVHDLEYLRRKNLNKISGEVQCKKCNARYNYEFDLDERFREIAEYIIENKAEMRDRAPKVWSNPDLPTCDHCGHPNCLKPVMPDNKDDINWLFLLLGRMLGFCTLDQLKYFCMHTKNHRTGAKDRVLYLTYLGLCKQLDPKGPFDR